MKAILKYKSLNPYEYTINGVYRKLKYYTSSYAKTYVIMNQLDYLCLIHEIECFRCIIQERKQ